MKSSSYGALVRAIGCVLMLLWIAGCGGGGSSGSGGGLASNGSNSSGGSSSSSSGGSSSIGGGGSSANGGGAADARSVLLDSIATKFSGFDGSNPDNENQQMLTYLKSKSDFVDSGLSPTGGVWGRFADGTTLIIANNADITQADAGIPPPPGRSAVTRAAGLPTTDKVILGAPIGSFVATQVDKMDQWFIDQNYTLQQPAATVDALKSISNVGVLFLVAHGGACPIRQGGPDVYIAWTETLRARDGSTDAKYSADLKDGSLTYFMGLAIQGANAVRKAETHYGITSKFVTKYWTGKFNPNSLVFIDACSSANFLTTDFQMACLNAGASTYMGWSDTEIIRDGLVTAYYLFDRMLGANQFDDKETPPQRAFSWTGVFADMHARQRPYKDSTGHQTNYDQSYNFHKGTTANLLALSLNANFQQLAPSIEVLTVDVQKDELTVNGTFGDSKGDVEINGNALTVKSWTNNQIVCDLPRTGDNASGNVTVIAGAPRQHSNTVQLTEWNGTVKCTQRDRGTLKVVMNFNLHFRADVHDRRVAPHQTPSRLVSNYLNDLDTSGTFETSGTYVTPDLTYSESWSGAGPIPAYVKPADPTAVSNVVIQGSIDKDRKWSMVVNALARNGNHVHVITKDSANGPVTSDTTVTKDVAWLSTGDLNGGLTLATLGTDFSIPAGSVTSPDQSMTVEWSAMAANHPPDSAAARSVKPSRAR